MGGDLKKLALPIVGLLGGAASGVISGSRAGAGEDLRNILRGIDFENLFAQPVEARVGEEAPALKVFPGAGAATSIEPVDPTKVLEPGLGVPEFEEMDVGVSGPTPEIPGVQAVSAPVEQVPPTAESVFNAPQVPGIEQIIRQAPVLREVVTPEGSRKVAVSQLQELGKQVDEDVALAGAVPQLFESREGLTVEDVVRPITSMQEGTQRQRELPENLKEAAIETAEVAPELDEPRVSEMLTINGAPIEMGSLLDQVGAEAGPEEAEGAPRGAGPVGGGKAAKKNEELRIDDDGLTVLEEWEGRRPQAYDDGAGNLTIGIGHLLTKEELDSGKVQVNGEMVDWREGLNDQQINRLAAQDAKEAADVVRKHVKVPLGQNQFNALVSFVFNVGAGAFKGSGALKALNAGDNEDFLRRLQLWNKAGGRVSAGLQKRRAYEAALFQHGLTATEDKRQKPKAPE